MATAAHPSDPDTRVAGSQFLVTLGDNTDYLDGKGAIFGKVVEGFDVLEKINDAIVDDRGHPLVDIRIKHTVVLDDPYPDPAGLREPSNSPPPTKPQLATVRIGEDEELLDEDANEEAAAEADRRRREREAAAQALTLEMMGDLPFAEVKPPENVLFVCKLNPVTTDEDLELIFSRFGKILSCEVIRDQRTGDSLQYSFIEFEDQKSCEEAYSKMDSVLIDDRRIHVDFSQSVSRLSEVWRNDTNTRRRSAATKKGGGGWGGVKELEKWRKYRNEDAEFDDDEKGYRMVHGMEELHGRHDKDQDAHRSVPIGRDSGPRDDSPPCGEPAPDRHGERYGFKRGKEERGPERRSRSPRRDRYQDNNYNRSNDIGRSRGDREWSHRDRRDHDQDRPRGEGKDADRYRGREEGRGR